MDYGKWRYQQQKKEDKSRAAAKGGRLKMLNIDTVRIGDHDLEIKVNRARDFLEEGNKVQFTLRFKGREMAHLDLGRNLFNKIKQELWLVSKVERDAKMEGKRMTLVLQPDHKVPGAKPPAPGQAGTVPPAGPEAGGGGPNHPAPGGAGGPPGGPANPAPPRNPRGGGHPRGRDAAPADQSAGPSRAPDRSDRPRG